MDTKEKFVIVARKLECHHAIFAKIWQMGRPVIIEDDKILPTAAVAFNKDGDFIQFLFNKNFLESLSPDEVCAIVSHECLHVILNHGKRGKNMIPEIANIAMDVTINEMLVSKFGFRKDLPVWEGKCFIDTVFGARKIDVDVEREFEYYYSKLMDNTKVVQISFGKGKGDGLMDGHEALPEDIDEAIKNAVSRMSDDEIDSLANKIGEPKDGSEKGGKESEAKDRKAGDGSSFSWVRKTLRPKKSNLWEKIIRNWSILKLREQNKQQWRRTNRRYSNLFKGSKFLLPSYESDPNKKSEKIDIVFFMDVSGSCHGDSEKFFRAAKTIPTDKFNIDAYAFDTGITKVDISKDKLPYGGGTSFHQLEEHLLKMKVYPSAVFVLTDGYGNNVNIRYPERWNVFLTVNYKNCFPKDVNFFDFNKMEHGKVEKIA